MDPMLHVADVLMALFGSVEYAARIPIQVCAPTAAEEIKVILTCVWIVNVHCMEEIVIMMKTMMMMTTINDNFYKVFT